MLELLNTYSISEIIIFLVIFAIAVKNVINFWDWGKARIKQSFGKLSEDEKYKENIEKRFEEGSIKMAKLEQQDLALSEALCEISEKLDRLIASDKDSIKSYITEKYHLHYEDVKWIDDYTLDCLEKRFAHYKAEGGNSFIENMMEELRSLKRRPPQD